MKRPKQTFRVWLETVNTEVEARIGLSVDDLPDCTFRTWYDRGVNPISAATKAIRHALDD